MILKIDFVESNDDAMRPYSIFHFLSPLGISGFAFRVWRTFQGGKVVSFVRPLHSGGRTCILYQTLIMIRFEQAYMYA